MDSLVRFSRRLRLVAFFALAAFCCAVGLQPGSASAQAGYQSYGSASSLCNAYLSTMGPTYQPGTCKVSTAGRPCSITAYSKQGAGFSSWYFDCGTYGTNCSSMANISGTVVTPDNSGMPSGINAGCVFFPCDANSASNGTGNTETKGTWCPTGVAAASGVSDTSGFGTNSVTQPKLCGATSCADPNAGKICSQVGGASVCVPAPSGWTGGASGAPYQPTCSSSGSGTVCAGSPAPLPPAPPSSPISDPATQIQGSDKYQVSSISGGSPNSATTTNGTLTVNTYGTPGTKANSGKTTGDNGPAPASSTAGSGSVSGGGDCNSPPVCSGDAVNCAMVREEWQTMCQVKTSGDQLHKDLAGDGTQQPPSGGQHTSSELTGSTVDTGDTSQLDSSGFGWDSSCPLQDFNVTVAGVAVSLSSFKPVCDNAGLYRAFVMLLAGLGCAAILGGFKVGSIFGGS